MDQAYTSDRWVLPEGIEELLPPQAERLEQLRRQLLDLFHRWGYELVIPPFIEYLESLLIGTGNDLDLQTFKLTDQLTGRLMGVRADMTPQVARIDAHHLRSDRPVRLCYLGTVLRTRPDGLAGSRSPLQIGAELYGHGGIESDVEVLRLMLEVLAATGIDDAHVDLGHVGIFRNLAHGAGLDPAQEGRLFDALQRKAKPEIGEFLAGLDLAEPQRRMLIALADLNGGDEVLAQARAELAPAGAEVHAAIDNLAEIAARVRRRRPSLELHFDLAELRGYHYHTGAVFAAYIPGYGQAVAQGGRYDDIGRAYGHARPATGFSADLRTLMGVHPPQAAQAGAVFAPDAEDTSLDEAIERLRAAGERVICALPGQRGGAPEMGCDRRLVRHGADWIVEQLEKHA